MGPDYQYISEVLLGTKPNSYCFTNRKNQKPIAIFKHTQSDSMQMVAC